jgi:CheY-like chemotaxis protein
LLVEDNPITQQLLQVLLENAGLEVAIVGNGQEAIDFLGQKSVDLIFMDCQMPYVDGLEATRQLRSMGLRTPVVALTAHAREEDEQRCLQAGMDDFLGKPFRKFELEDLLGKWLPANAGKGLARRETGPPGGRT